MFTVSVPSAFSRGVRTRRVLSAARLAAVSMAVAAAASCTSAQLDGVAPSYLIVDSIEAASGADPSRFGGFLQSDVVSSVTTQVDGEQVRVPTIFEDLGRVSLRVAMTDPGSIETPTTPSVVNQITITRYRVEFIRADGRNVPGVDVPYPFDGAMTLTVDGSGQSAAMVLVRIQAKREAPLSALAGGGGAFAISTLARVTFYGRDQAGRDVNAVGLITVNFADWADPE